MWKYIKTKMQRDILILDSANFWITRVQLHLKCKLWKRLTRGFDESTILSRIHSLRWEWTITMSPAIEWISKPNLLFSIQICVAGVIIYCHYPPCLNTKRLSEDNILLRKQISLQCFFLSFNFHTCCFFTLQQGKVQTKMSNLDSRQSFLFFPIEK